MDASAECGLLRQQIEKYWEVIVAKTKQPVTSRVFDKLSQTLESGIDIHRCVSATALADIAHPGASTVLQKALLDEDEDVRTDAMNALIVLQDPGSAEAALENLLGDPCPEVKLAAMELLTQLNYRPVIPWLLKLVVSETDEINWDHEGYYQTGWEDWLDIQRVAIKALGEFEAAEAVPGILDAISDEDGQDVTQLAIPVLARLGEVGIDALEQLFDSGDAQMRRRICSSLIAGSSAQVDVLLLAGLEDKDDSVRLVAVEKLLAADINDPRLVGFYQDTDENVRRLIVESLGASNPEKITQMLSDPAPGVRQVAFRTIAAEPEFFENEGFSEVVRQAIAGVPEIAGDAAVAWAALIGAPSANSLGSALQNPAQPLAFRIGLIEALTLLDEAGLPYLAEAAGDERRQVRVSALSAIAEIAAETSWPNNASQILLAALKGELVQEPEETDLSDEAEEDEEVPVEVVEPVEEKEATSTLDQIMNSEVQADNEPKTEPVQLSEEDQHFIDLSKMRAMRKGKVSLDVKIAPFQDVRRFAARLLGDFNETAVPVQLADALNYQDDELKQSCLESLGVIGQTRGRLNKSLYKAVVAEAEHQDRAIRRLAARCLGFINGKNATSQLANMCNDADVHVRLEATRALGRKKDQVDTMLKALQDEYSGVRLEAAKSLAANQLAMDELVALTFRYDGMHRNDIVTLFRDWNPLQACDKYLEILDDDIRKRDWLVAIQAVGQLLKKPENEKIRAAA